MTPRIALIVLLLTTTMVATSQVRRTIREDFSQVPQFWTYIEDRDDATITRRIEKGVMYGRLKENTNLWTLAYRLIDATKDWSMSAEVVIDSSRGNEGVMLVAATGSDYYMFKVSGGHKSQWVGVYNYSDKSWRTITVADSRGLGDRACPVLRGNGTKNTLKVERAADHIQFVVNDSVIERWPMDGAFTSLMQKVDAFGLGFSNTVTARFDRFDASYTEPIMPIVPDAFVGVQRTFMPQFQGKSSRYPVISPNGQQLYYIVARDGMEDDIYVADALTDSTWSDPRLLSGLINNTAANNVISVSQDGNELLVWGAYKSDGTSNGGGFSTTRRTATDWSVPQLIRNSHQVNKSSTREECLSADRSVMIAAREIEGATSGLKDLYVSFRQSDGSYGPLINLGPEVNTKGNDGAPFLAADGVTLYFSSPENTYGDGDMFVSKRLDDTWTKWSPRINLGPSLNSPYWDCYFTIHPSGKYAYMNTSDGVNSGIFRLKLPQDAASRKLLPDPVVVVRGRVLNAATKSPLGVDIRYENLATATAIGTAVSAPADGRYSIVLRGGTNYGFFAEKDGFFPVSDNIELSSLQAYAEVERDLYLEPIIEGAVIRLNNLFFDTDKATVRPESVPELDRLIAMLAKRSTISVSIEGHTDDRGTPQHNDALSKNRANAVREYLASHGIDPKRLTAQGFGKAKPLVRGTSDEARTKNRRVEFRIVSL